MKDSSTNPSKSETCLPSNENDLDNDVLKADSSSPQEKVVLFVGNGGVGKTTLATLFAIKSAQKNLKTLLLTIDPSKRLSSLLGLDAKSGKIVQVKDPRLNGKLFATCVVPEIEFEAFIYQHVKDANTLEQIKKNTFYREFTSVLGASQDFTSLYKMSSLVTEGEYDLVVLDTPPAINSKNFFEAAKNIYALLDSKILSTFLKINLKSNSKLVGLIKRASYQALSLIGRIAGKEFAKSLLGLFDLLQVIKTQIKEVSTHSDSILKSSQSKIYLVSDLSHSVERKIWNLIEYFKQKGYHLNLVLLNRVMMNSYSKLDKYPETDPYKASISKKLNSKIDLFQEIEKNQSLLYKQVKESLAKECPSITISEFQTPPVNIESLIKIADTIVLSTDSQ